MSYDNVNRPSHYAEGRQYEPIAVIEDWELGYHLGNALKYISRAGRKDDIRQDLRKAVWYIERHIEAVEDQNCTIEQEQVDYEAGCVNLYTEVLKADPRDLEEPRRLVWDSDETWMHEGPSLDQHYEKAVEVAEGAGYGHTLNLECGWDPTLGPTC